MHLDVPDSMNKYYGRPEDVALLLNVPFRVQNKLLIVSTRLWSKR